MIAWVTVLNIPALKNHLEMGADTKGFKIQINKEPVCWEVIVLPKENYFQITAT